MRKGPPLPPFIFIGNAIMNAPLSGVYQDWQHFQSQEYFVHIKFDAS